MRPLDVIARLRAGDRLHMQLLEGRQIWWFEAPHEVVPEASVKVALQSGELREAGDSLFGLPLNSQTWIASDEE